MRRVAGWTAATLAFAAAGAWALPPTGNSYWAGAPSAAAPAQSWSQGGSFDGRGLGGIRAGGLPISKGDNYEFDIFGRLQAAGYAENVSPVGPNRRNNDRVYLFLKQARMGFYGHFSNDVRYESQFAYGGEEASPYSSNTPSLTLLTMDANVATPMLGKNSSIKVGQFRVPFSRQGMTNRGYIPYLDRGLSSLGFGFGRDVGLAYENDGGQNQRWVGTVGTFTGGGEDAPTVNPPHLLPENLGIPMMAARFGYNDGIDEDIYHVSQDDLNINKTEKAAYVDGLFMKDTEIGHSTVLNINDTYPKPMLLDADFNPYLARGAVASLQAGDVWMADFDSAYRTPLGDSGMAFLSQFEADYGGYSNSIGSLHMAAGAAQAGLLDTPGLLGKPLELMFRYSLLAPENAGYYDSTNNHTYTFGQRVIHEVTPSLSWFLHGENLKLVADVPVYFNMPVFNDPASGSYVFADYPTEITNQSNTGATVTRRTVTEARMMLQFLF